MMVFFFQNGSRQCHTIVFALIIWASFSVSVSAKDIEQWGVFELSLKGTSKGNPYTEIQLSADFRFEDEVINVKGFYDGDGIYKVRFMPDKVGSWSYETISNSKGLRSKKGVFQCVAPSKSNNGPVKVFDTLHFSYANGEMYYPIGTTVYGCMQQADSIYAQTLASLAKAPFNKARVALLPHAPSGKNPIMYPYEGTKPKTWDFERFNPAYFRLYETRILDFLELGIEVDLFVFHPYDKGVWGFDQMNKEEQYLYLNYINARFGAYRNIWWSMANEYNLMKHRVMEDWDGYFSFFEQNDPYQHLRSIHNGGKWYDHSKDWVTHVSCQTESWWEMPGLREKYNKPIVTDEFCYEGNDWARITALNGAEIVHRFWLYTVSGTYATHGEAYIQENGYQFFRQGGQLSGESIAGISFLQGIINELPGPLAPDWEHWRLNQILGRFKDEFYLYYLGVYQNKVWLFDELPEGSKYEAEIIDTKEMTITKVDEMITKGSKLTLPGKTHMAIRLTRIVN